jgi:acyl carrier protein
MMQRLWMTARFARMWNGASLAQSSKGLAWSGARAFGAHEEKGGQLQTKVEKKKDAKKKDIQQYIDGALVSRTHLVLKKKEDIDTYVLNMIRNYFRTTNKAGLSLESNLIDHGLDSLDSIELAMQVEEDLGYVISAETLPVLNRPKHFVNYIWHVEQFKEANDRAPLS